MITRKLTEASIGRVLKSAGGKLLPKKSISIFQLQVFGASLFTRHLHELRGKNLACWCKLDEPCHADVLLKLANATKEK